MKKKKNYILSIFLFMFVFLKYGASSVYAETEIKGFEVEPLHLESNNEETRTNEVNNGEVIPEPEKEIAHKKAMDASVLATALDKYLEKNNENDVPISKILFYSETIFKHKKNYDPIWIAAMMYQESRLQESVTSSHGAIGLLQLMPDTAKVYGINKTQLFNPAVNIKTGITYYDYLKKEFNNDTKLATIAYNQGIGRVRRGKHKSEYYYLVYKHYIELRKIVNTQL